MSKSIIFLLKSFLGNFYREFSGHTGLYERLCRSGRCPDLQLCEGASSRTRFRIRACPKIFRPPAGRNLLIGLGTPLRGDDDDDDHHHDEEDAEKILENHFLSAVVVAQSVEQLLPTPVIRGSNPVIYYRLN